MLIIIFLYICILYMLFFTNDNFTDININNIELVISRYNENLSWINNDLFKNYLNIIYNKGVNEYFTINNLTKNIVKLDNVGRESGTYLYYIINNYDKLANITVFLPGSVNIKHKYTRAKILIEELEKYNDTVFVGEKYDNIQNDLYNFKLDEYQSSDDNNKMLNPESKLELSAIRPFGLWYENKFGDYHSTYISYFGIIGISKNDILQHPKSYYENLYSELSTSSNPEVGHYFERSWEAVFKPKNAKYIYLPINDETHNEFLKSLK